MDKRRKRVSRHAHIGFLFISFVLLAVFPACRRAITQGPLAFISNERDGTITVIDLTANQVVQTIPTGGRARGIRLGPDGKTVYVALTTQNGQIRKPEDDRIAAIDIASG